MGIIIHDTLTLQNGLQVTDSYASLAKQVITIQKGYTQDSNSNTYTSVWKTTSLYNIWTNKDMASNNAPYVQQETITVGLSNQQLNEPTFQTLYNGIKSRYQSTSDA